MTGIQFITDEKGRRTAAVIDLKKHRALYGRALTMSWFLGRGMKNASRWTR